MSNDQRRYKETQPRECCRSRDKFGCFDTGPESLLVRFESTRLEARGELLLSRGDGNRNGTRVTTSSELEETKEKMLEETMHCFEIKSEPSGSRAESTVQFSGPKLEPGAEFQTTTGGPLSRSPGDGQFHRDLAMERILSPDRL